MDRPANGSWFAEGELVDADFVVDLLETFRFGKDNLPAGRVGHKAAEKVTPATEKQGNTTKKQDEEAEEEDGEGFVGNTSVHESTGSVSSSSDPMVLVAMSETGLPNEPVSNEESGYNWLESSSSTLPNVENERHQNVEEEEKDKVEEEEDKKSVRTSSESEEKSNIEKLLAIQETYELYCPSCSSCITKEVIIRKKEHGKLVGLPAALRPYVSSDIEEIGPPVKPHAPEKLIENDDQEVKKKGYFFACLACLKYYIYLGKSNSS